MSQQPNTSFGNRASSEPSYSLGGDDCCSDSFSKLQKLRSQKVVAYLQHEYEFIDSIQLGELTDDEKDICFLKDNLLLLMKVVGYNEQLKDITVR